MRIPVKQVPPSFGRMMEQMRLGADAYYADWYVPWYGKALAAIVKFFGGKIWA
jgi:hypothetical protein